MEFGLSPDILLTIRALRQGLLLADEERQEEIREKIHELTEEYSKQTTATVIVRNIVHPGVVLVCNKIIYEVKRKISGMVFYKPKSENEICMCPYDHRKDS